MIILLMVNISVELNGTFCIITFLIINRTQMSRKKITQPKISFSRQSLKIFTFRVKLSDSIFSC